MFRRGFKTWSEQTSARIRQKLGVPADSALDLTRVAESLGVFIVGPHELADLENKVRDRLLGANSDDWSALTVTDGSNFLIVLNTSHAPTRRNSDLAHEIAHIILGHEPSKMFMSSASDFAIRAHDAAQEEEAAWLAGALLLPREALLKLRRERVSDEETYKNYQVSKAMLRYRVSVTGVDAQMGRVAGWRRKK
jgi:Zn-dependent peptidase ImmA (M78 family)